MPPTGVRTASASAGVALAVLAATATIVPGASAAPPAAPFGLEATSPNTTTTVLSWDREVGATKYTVQVDNDPSFGSPEFNQVTTNVSAVPHTALKAGLNHWRVRSINTGNEVSEWTTSTFDGPTRWSPPGRPRRGRHPRPAGRAAAAPVVGGPGRQVLHGRDRRRARLHRLGATDHQHHVDHAELAALRARGSGA
ncbi:hypothetical protein [Nocardioides daphniae]|uniref:Fibronectin type III domain-containing protein n=1 Tax=Nocardioides daphniae TaxID=402297 RepID=A0A4P7UBT9_9ACTN|nr:hypothetical protein [Nocardioides daphniae]QCC76971.1 hypothetical protein E2C04_06625 [Nocardioides daphniae]